MSAREDSAWPAVLEGLDLRPLPEDFHPDQMFLICRGTPGTDPDDVAWVTRASAIFNREEFLGALIAYLEHMKQELAAEWQE